MKVRKGPSGVPALKKRLRNYCREVGETEAQVRAAALEQYLTIKREEQFFRNKCPSDYQIKSKFVIEGIPANPAEKVASVLTY